jgi:predicted ATPase with chaperone activity
MPFSLRGSGFTLLTDRVRKVARTIADLDGAAAISADHVAEALEFRLL